jgi:Lipid A 3-O-deacylase (PagL)
MNECLARPVRGCIYIFLIILLYGCGFTVASARAQSAARGEEATATEPAERHPVALPDAPRSLPSDLPDAPAPAFRLVDAPTDESSSLSSNPDLNGSPDSWSLEVAPASSERVPLSECPSDTTRARECRVHWKHLIITSSVFNAFQNAGNLYTGFWYRYETTHGPWFQRWFNSVTEWRWDRWSDDNPFTDDYVAHPMMGAITNYIWIQDDPKGATVEFGNTPEYWRSRLRATLFSTAYSFEWKMGPFGEAGVGHNGDHFFYDKGVLTNETGWVELVTTPVGGLAWTMAEDALDRHVVKRFEEKPRGPAALLLISFLTPSRATANILRFRPPWYRDGREVKAKTFWSEPPGPDDVAEESGEASGGAAASSAVEPVRKAEVLPVWPHYGGVHEFGAWWGLSLMSGHVWGYAKDIKYMPVDLTYSYLWYRGDKWNFRYAPELTALAMLDEPQSGQKNFLYQRKRTYGSGLSPVGFRASFFPESRVQPFLSTDGGFIYFTDRVLSPQGSQYMYTIDFGGGLQIFRKQRQSVTIGYRYQHLSNANISHHNPGTDTNVFYVAVSRFRTKGYR